MNDIDIARLGTAPRHYTVNSIKDESGRSLPFDHDGESLLVGVENLQGETIKLTFDISGNFLIRAGGDNAWQLGTDEWFPMPGLGGQYYTVHSVVKVRKPFVPFAPGKTIRREEEGDFNVVENVIDAPVQVVHAGKYDIAEETRGNLTIRIATYGGRNERAAKQLTSLAYSVIDYYQFFLGPFPFPELNIIQINTWGFAQAGSSAAPPKWRVCCSSSRRRTTCRSSKNTTGERRCRIDGNGRRDAARSAGGDAGAPGSRL